MEDDLIKLSGPLTEHAVIKTLQTKFCNGLYQTSVGPVLLSLNPNRVTHPLEALEHRESSAGYPHLLTLANSVIQTAMETHTPQSLITSGICGSGKTFTLMALLRQLLQESQTTSDHRLIKHLCASLIVLNSLGNAYTPANPHSSRMSQLVECHLSGEAIVKTKVHSFLVDLERISNKRPEEGNFDIFYEILEGLSDHEKVQYHLQGYSTENLVCLSCGREDINRIHDGERFQIWKDCLATLGIHEKDILRTLAAVMLLGNVSFQEDSELKHPHVDITGENEFQSVAAVLGIDSEELFKALTTSVNCVKGQVFCSPVGEAKSNRNIQLLAQVLYCRTVSAILKRANGSHKVQAGQGGRGQNPATDNDSQYSSPHASRVGVSLLSPDQPTASSTSSQMYTHQLNRNNFIALLDMYGLQNLQDNSLEQLCVNLAAETLMHYYNTVLFKTTEEAYVEEGIQAEMDVYYFENAPVVELLSSQKTGILSLLEAECMLHKPSTDSLLQRIRIQHLKEKHFEDVSRGNSGCSFIVKHFSGPVQYNAEQFIDTNRKAISRTVIALFAKKNCAFGFASHLFSHELQHMKDKQDMVSGITYGLSGPSGSHNGKSVHKSVTYLSEDFHSHLDGVLKVLLHTQPHFINCIQTNRQHRKSVFERECVLEQVRCYEVLETTHLMATGFPHTKRYKVFNQRYRILYPTLLRERSKTSTELAFSESKQILDHFMKTIESQSLLHLNTQWALGKKHIFLSETVSRLLEVHRQRKRHNSAIVIQTAWRCHHCTRKWPYLKKKLILAKSRKSSSVRKLQVSNVPTRSRSRSLSGSLDGRDSGWSPRTSQRHSNSLDHYSQKHSNSLETSSQKHSNSLETSTQRHSNSLETSTQRHSNSLDRYSHKHSNSLETSSQRHSNSLDRYSHKHSNSLETSSQRHSHSLSDFSISLPTEQPPSLPAPRKYTIHGNRRVDFPQTRIMKENYSEPGKPSLTQGQLVSVTSTANQPGYLLILHRDRQLAVPHHITEIYMKHHNEET